MNTNIPPKPAAYGDFQSYAACAARRSSQKATAAAGVSKATTSATGHFRIVTSVDTARIVPIRAAVGSALTEPLTVIQGPPGTGKSQVVAAILANAAWRGQRREQSLRVKDPSKQVDVRESPAIVITVVRSR
jgi:hypothetical protein